MPSASSSETGVVVVSRARALLVAVLLWPGVQPVLLALSTIGNSTIAGAAVEQDRVNQAPFRTFEAAVLAYVRLRHRLQAEVPALVLTNDPQVITNASTTLAAAIQRARRGAKKGDLFDQTAVSEITRRVRSALQGVNVAAFLSDINDESTFRGQPKVHLRFPEANPMATMPSALLNVLPPLPTELEYRLLGRHLILRDRDAALVIDYLTDVIPPR